MVQAEQDAVGAKAQVLFHGVATFTAVLIVIAFNDYVFPGGFVARAIGADVVIRRHRDGRDVMKMHPCQYEFRFAWQAVPAGIKFDLALIVDDHMLGQKTVLDGILADRCLAGGRPRTGTLAGRRKSCGSQIQEKTLAVRDEEILEDRLSGVRNQKHEVTKQSLRANHQIQSFRARGF